MLEKILNSEIQNLVALTGNIDDVGLNELTENLSDQKHYEHYLNAEKYWQIYKYKVLNEIEELPEEKSNLIIKDIKFDKDMLQDTLKKMAALRMNFLIRPNFTLEKFIFADELHKIKEEIILKLGYFYDYKYLIDGIKQTLNSEELIKKDIISLPEFRSLLKKFDANFIDALTVKEFSSLLQPANQFFTDHGLKGIPIFAISLFLHDKKMNDAADEINALINDDDDLMSYDEIEKNLEDLINDSDDDSESTVDDEIVEVQQPEDPTLGNEIESVEAEISDEPADQEVELEEELHELQGDIEEPEMEKIDEANVDAEVLENADKSETPENQDDDEFNMDDFEALADSIMEGEDVKGDEPVQQPIVDTETNTSEDIEELNSMIENVKNKTTALDKVTDELVDPNDTLSALDSFKKSFSIESESDDTDSEEDISLGYSDDILNQLSEEDKEK